MLGLCALSLLGHFCCAHLIYDFIWFLIILCSANRRWKRKWLKKQRAKSSDHPSAASGSNSESDFSINSGTLQLLTPCSLFHPLMQAMAGGAGLRPAPFQTTRALKRKPAQLLIVRTSLQLTVRGGRQKNQFYREYWIRPRGSGPLPRKVFLRS
jgi:hypothetical protein